MRHFVAQLLFLSKRACPYIQTAVSFLCTRVRGPDTDDYKNLERLMKYIQGTIGLPLILSIDKSGNIKWYVHAAFAVNKDMGSHTGGFMTMGIGGTYVHSRNQNQNTKSLTEANLAGEDDILTQLIWTRYLLKEHRFMIQGNGIYQYNQSAIRLENDVRCSRIKRHKNIRYYFITDRIVKQEASVKFCPTLDMIGYYFTKALQGFQFHLFRNIIIGIHEDDMPAYNTYVNALLE